MREYGCRVGGRRSGAADHGFPSRPPTDLLAHEGFDEITGPLIDRADNMRPRPYLHARTSPASPTTNERVPRRLHEDDGFLHTHRPPLAGRTDLPGLPAGD